MSNINVQIESTRYGGFTSYGNGQVSTLKPGIYNQYNKDVYKQISDYHNREIPYFEDKTRHSSIYNEDYLKTVKQDNYHARASKSQVKIDLDKYQYAHEPNAIDILNEKHKRNDDTIRSK
jgi:hypothetical protein